MNVRFIVLAVVCAAALAAAACGNSSPAPSPSAPSSFLAGTSSPGTTGSTGETTASGQVLRLAGTCPTLTFALGGTAVKTTADTRYESGSCAMVRLSSQVGATGTMRGATLVATRMRVAAPQR